jgi:hypothetical protein
VSGERREIRDARDKFERRLVENGVPQREARKEAIKQAQKADRNRNQR